MGLAFAHLNLRQNPFGELTHGARASLAVVDLEPVTGWLDAPRRAVQLLGDHGRGKTTHLLALQRAVPDACYVRAWRDRPLRLCTAAVLLLDEADTTWPWVRWWALWRAPARLVVSTHRDLSRELGLAGYAVRTVPVGRPSPDRLAEVFLRRIEHCRRGPGPVPTVPPDLLAGLVRRHGDDVRAMEHELYDRVQALDAPTEL